jgi:hypothetical protein
MDEARAARVKWIANRVPFYSRKFKRLSRILPEVLSKICSIPFLQLVERFSIARPVVNKALRCGYMPFIAGSWSTISNASQNHWRFVTAEAKSRNLKHFSALVVHRS